MNVEEILKQVPAERREEFLKFLVEDAQKRKKKKCIKSVVIAIVLVIAAVFAVKGIIEYAYNNELRNMATEEMHSDYANVYADVVSINPVYMLNQITTYSHGGGVGSQDIICKCKTVEGTHVWVAISKYDYPSDVYSLPGQYKTVTFEPEHPARLSGYIMTSEEISDKLKVAIGGAYVLRVKDLAD